MSTFITVTLWVLPSVLLSLWAGFYISRLFGRNERAENLSSLLAILQSTEEIRFKVNNQKTKIEDVGRTVKQAESASDFQVVQEELLYHIADLMDSNRKLEDDLTCARYQMQEQTQELDRSRKEARTDTLSGVSNRKAFDEALDFWLSFNKRREDSFSLVFVDIDHFKWINDAHGHAAGDRVVRDLGEFMKSSLRADDYVARYGGDEFAIMLRHYDVSTAMETAERMRVEIQRRNFFIGEDGARTAVTFSMGLATVRDDDTAESLLRRADAALYKSKKEGRNQLTICDSDETLQKMEIECRA